MYEMEIINFFFFFDYVQSLLKDALRALEICLENFELFFRSFKNKF